MTPAFDQLLTTLLHSPDMATFIERLGIENLRWSSAALELPDAIDPNLAAALKSLFALAAERFQLRSQVVDLDARLRRDVSYFRDESRGQRDLRSLTGDSAAMKAVRLAIQQVAATDSTALILGETGTGKELVARAIHQMSRRHAHHLVSVNCAALASSILTSELFGHEAGAFTGAAKRRLGRFELAQEGSLFLDEIAEMSAEAQVLLLRVLQERVLERVGGNEPVALDVRVLAATHRDLDAEVAAGRFRADLFYRLNVFPIRVPPLRDRRDDLPDLIRHFLRHFNRRMNKQVADLDAASLRLLQGYAWPGNVRELENFIERAMIVTAGSVLRVDPGWLKSDAAPVEDATFEETQRRVIEDALAKANGKIYGPAGAAEMLGLKPTTLYGKMRKLGIER